MITIQFTKEEINNLSILIGGTTIKASEALTVALLQQKLANSILGAEAKVEETVAPIEEKTDI
jgi:hypothetical protein